MIMASVVGTKGQVVIEKSIREKLGVQPGFVAVQTLVDDHVEVRFYPPEHDRSLRGVLADSTNVSVALEEWQRARSKAWADAAPEKFKPKENDT